MLLSGATTFERGEQVGHLVVPKSWNRPESLGLIPGRWAMDNGAFAGFDPGAFVRMLEAFHGYRGELFVTAPDVVGDAAATFALWSFWSHLLEGLRRRPAYVVQDGITPDLLPDAPAYFIGGTTTFKESEQVARVCAYAKARGIWVHWGRVNTKRRMAIAARAGVDSYDGTGWSMFPEARVPKAIAWSNAIEAQPSFLDSREAQHGQQ